LEILENAVNFAGQPNKKLTIFVFERSTWIQKWHDRYLSDASKRAEQTDGYLNQPSSKTSWTTFKPLEKRGILAESVTRNVLPESQFLEKDLNDIPISIKRGREKIACRVGGIVFYPVIGKLRIFTRCVYFRYENTNSDAKWDNPEPTHPDLFLAMPLDFRGCLVTGEIFTSLTPSGVGWIVYPGDRTQVGYWLANEIHPTVRFQEFRTLKVDPLPPIPDPDDSIVSILRRKIRMAQESRLLLLDQSKYVGKTLSEIPLKIPEDKELLVGKCRFWSSSVNFVCTRVKTLKLLDDPPDELPLSRSGWINFALRVDDAGFPFTNILWCWGSLNTPATWVEYSGDSQRVLNLIARKIHESVKVGEIRAPRPWVWKPFEEPIDSYKSQLTMKCAKARQMGIIQLATEKYAQKQLNEIQLELMTPDGYCSCKVGKLMFSPVSKGEFVVVRGEDLCSAFESLWFGFKLVRNCLDTKTIYRSTNNGWQPYAPGNTAYHTTILGLIRSAIYGEATPVISQQECTEMNEAYRVSSALPSTWLSGGVLHTPAEQLQMILESEMPTERKVVQLEKFLCGSLYPIDWDMLTQLFKHPLLADKTAWIQEAKKQTFSGVVGIDPEYETKMLEDPEIQEFAQSPEIAEIRVQRSNEMVE
jgi:hypothetical protein